MTKEQFLTKVSDTKSKTYLVQAIQLENGDKEIQVTPFTVEKTNYIAGMYDNEMRHNRNNKVRIVDVMVV